MKIAEQVNVAIDHIGVHITGPRLDIMLHMSIFEAMKLKNGHDATATITVEIENSK